MSRIRLAAAGAALWSLCVAGGALAGPAPAAPAAKSFHLGAFEVTALRDARNIVPNDGSVFGADPPAAAKLLAQAGAPTDAVSLSIDALLVRTPGHLVLLDTGLGPSHHGVLQASLTLAGVSADQVTDVLITHSHGDHVGGLTDDAGKPAFPRAVVRMSAKEWAWMQAQDPKLAAVIAPQVQAFEPGQPILPGITPVALYGHTPGHTGYVIRSQGHALEDIGDIAHSSILSLARPDWRDGYDTDKAAGEATRRTELGRLAAGHDLVFAPHFPFPGVGHVVADGQDFAWKPAALGQ